jgi:hypothetical protein
VLKKGQYCMIKIPKKVARVKMARIQPEINTEGRGEALHTEKSSNSQLRKEGSAMAGIRDVIGVEAPELLFAGGSLVRAQKMGSFTNSRQKESSNEQSSDKNVNLGD